MGTWPPASQGPISSLPSRDKSMPRSSISLFWPSVVDIVMMLSASQKASWPTSSLVIPSSGRHVPAQQKSGQSVYTTRTPPPQHTHKHKPPREARPCSLCNLGGWDVSFTDSFFCEFSHAHLNLLMDSPKTKWESQLFPLFRGQGETFRVTSLYLLVPWGGPLLS